MTALAVVPQSERLPWIERRGIDFPFYKGVPVALSAGRWQALMLSVVLAFGVLNLPMSIVFALGILFLPVANGAILYVVISLLLFGLPLLTLNVIAPGTIGALYRRVEARDIVAVIACLLVGLLTTGVVSVLVANAFGAAEHPIFEAIEGHGFAAVALVAFITLIQLPGEELFTIIPFLAVLAWAHGTIGFSRRKAVVIAWLVSSVIFGMAHLPVYDWNWVQCIVVIGMARVILTLAYVITKNLWVSTILHIAFDWVLLGLGLTIGGTT